jgi:hypothetical protein
LELVGQLGSGVPRIMESYGKECFRFMDNFTRMTFPVSEQVTEQVKNLIAIFHNEHSRNELIESLAHCIYIKPKKDSLLCPNRRNC